MVLHCWERLKHEHLVLSNKLNYHCERAFQICDCGNLIKPNFESQHAIVLEVGGTIDEHYASDSLRNTTQDFSQMVSHPFIN